MSPLDLGSPLDPLGRLRMRATPRTVLVTGATGYIGGRAFACVAWPATQRGCRADRSFSAAARTSRGRHLGAASGPLGVLE